MKPPTLTWKLALAAPFAWLYEHHRYCRASGTRLWNWRAARNLRLPADPDRWFRR